MKTLMKPLAIAIMLALLALATPPLACCSSTEHIDLAEYWAPVWYQDTDSTDYDAEYITRFDFDGNWLGSDNWENQPFYPLPAYIYYWVVETETNWFIGYADFHPRDWTDFPLIDTQHENDLEGCVLVIQRDGSEHGQFLLMITIAHWNFLSYKDFDSLPSGNVTSGTHSITGDVEFYDGHHPYLYVESEGHGVYGDQRWEDSDFPGGDGVVYYYTGVAEEPSGGNDRDVGYALESIDELWEMRYPDEHPDTWYAYGTFEGDITPGVVAMTANAADAPWGWDDWNDGDAFESDLFMDPAYIVDYYHDGLGDFSHTYVSRSYSGVLESFHPYRSDFHRTWAWRVPGADEVRVHFTSIETEADDDTITFLDGNGTQVGEAVSGEHTDYWSPWVAGDTIQVRLDSDGDSNRGWGFSADVFETLPAPGDANGDGDINMQDVTYTELIILGYMETTPGADANSDSDVNMGDVTTIELMILGYL